MMKQHINKTKRNLKQALYHRQTGNTLVPVVFGLAIAAVTTVSFLNQGASLDTQNNRQLAMNQLSALISQFEMARSIGTALAAIDGGTVPILNDENPFGNAIQLGAVANNVRVLTYATDSAETCGILQPLFNVRGRIRASACGDGAANMNLLLNLN